MAVPSPLSDVPDLSLSRGHLSKQATSRLRMAELSWPLLLLLLSRTSQNALPWKHSLALIFCWRKDSIFPFNCLLLGISAFKVFHVTIFLHRNRCWLTGRRQKLRNLKTQSRGLPHSAVQHHDHSLEPELKTQVWVSSAVSVSSVCWQVQPCREHQGGLPCLKTLFPFSTSNRMSQIHFKLFV